MSTPPNADALKYRLAQLDTEISRAESTRRTAAIGMLLAIIGTLVFVPLIPLWGLIGIAGLLSWVTNAGKVGTLKKERAGVVEALGY